VTRQSRIVPLRILPACEWFRCRLLSARVEEQLWATSVFIDCVESDELIGDARCSGHVGFFLTVR
jgi:hypothetical protein